MRFLFRIRVFSRVRSSRVFGLLLIGYADNIFALFVQLVLSKFCVIVCSKMLVRLLLGTFLGTRVFSRFCSLRVFDVTRCFSIECLV